MSCCAFHRWKQDFSGASTSVKFFLSCLIIIVSGVKQSLAKRQGRPKLELASPSVVPVCLRVPLTTGLSTDRACRLSASLPGPLTTSACSDRQGRKVLADVHRRIRRSDDEIQSKNQKGIKLVSERSQLRSQGVTSVILDRSRTSRRSRRVADLSWIFFCGFPPCATLASPLPLLLDSHRSLSAPSSPQGVWPSFKVEPTDDDTPLLCLFFFSLSCPPLHPSLLVRGKFAAPRRSPSHQSLERVRSRRYVAVQAFKTLSVSICFGRHWPG